MIHQGHVRYISRFVWGVIVFDGDGFYFYFDAFKVWVSMVGGSCVKILFEKLVDKVFGMLLVGRYRVVYVLCDCCDRMIGQFSCAIHEFFFGVRGAKF